MTDALDAWVSMKRIDEYLESPEIQPIKKEGPEVTFENASIAWPVDDDIPAEGRFVLRDLSLKFPKGELSVISGKTGRGKSLLLAAILGEADLLKGRVRVPRAPSFPDRHDYKATRADWIIPGAVAYVAQIPWIENASIRDNILFGLPLEEARYRATIDACALKKDLEMFTDGELTEVGANGINLSGGQKWRVTLARAMYSRAGILVMDDIFSAVDSHVGRHLFEHCVCGPLGHGRTRILVTHHVALCAPKTSYLVELGEGQVLHAGFVADMDQDGTLDLIKQHEQSQQRLSEAATAVNSDDSGLDDGIEDADGSALQRVVSKSAAHPRKFVEDESRDIGAVKTHVYLAFLRESGGWLFWICVFVVFISFECIGVGRSWWLKIWTSNNQKQDLNSFDAQGFASGLHVQQAASNILNHSYALQEEKGLSFYLGIFVALAVSSTIISTLRSYVLYFGSIRASRRLFEKMNHVILRTPLRWLDTVPVGRVLNRFTADFSTVDSSLMNHVWLALSYLLQLVTVVVAGVFVSPLLVVFALLLLPACTYYALRYLTGARPAKRLESTSKSPVFEVFGSVLTGVSTIRAFDQTSVYISRMHDKIDDYSTTSWYLWLFNRWMALRMALVGSAFSVAVAATILLTPGMEPSLAGFALAFALEFSNAVMWTVRNYANLELDMNAVERVVEYTELLTEPLGGASPPAAWPTEGRLDVENLVVAYASDLPPVLKGVNFSVKKNERVGVIGRTGAGKSSLTLALFRFLEAREGRILIDGVDISKIKLHDLRSRLAIIPQDPVLFSGTVRTNLDPFDQHSESALLECLRRVHLVPEAAAANPSLAAVSSAFVHSETDGRKSTGPNPIISLDTPISEGGLNLSQGQRQLLCLARAIVSRPKVMVLDEATSAVDMATDALIQSSIRHGFEDSTLLVIAHRLSTIADFDRILVLSEGTVAEYGSAQELWGDDGGEAEGGKANENWGVFRSMCEESGERQRLRNIVFGQVGSEASSSRG